VAASHDLRHNFVSSASSAEAVPQWLAALRGVIRRVHGHDAGQSSHGSYATRLLFAQEKQLRERPVCPRFSLKSLVVASRHAGTALRPTAVRRGGFHPCANGTVKTVL
jgi:hypothetical protein